MLGAGSNHVGGRIWPAGRQLGIPAYLILFPYLIGFKDSPATR